MTELQVTEIINVINLTVIDQTTTTDYEITEVVETIHLTITEKFGSDGLPGPPGPASTVPGPKGDPGTSITKTSELTNDGEDGMHPFITAEDLIPIQIPDFTQHGPITTTANSVTIGLSPLGENFAVIAGTKYVEPTSNPETPKLFTPVSTGKLKVLIIQALPDAQVFHLVEGVEGTEAVIPYYSGLFVASIIVSDNGGIVTEAGDSSYKNKGDDIIEPLVINDNYGIWTLALRNTYEVLNHSTSDTPTLLGVYTDAKNGVWSGKKFYFKNSSGKILTLKKEPTPPIAGETVYFSFNETINLKNGEMALGFLNRFSEIEVIRLVGSEPFDPTNLQNQINKKLDKPLSPYNVNTNVILGDGSTKPLSEIGGVPTGGNDGDVLVKSGTTALWSSIIKGIEFLGAAWLKLKLITFNGYTITQRNDLGAVTEGTLIYVTDSPKGFQVYENGGWVRLVKNLPQITIKPATGVTNITTKTLDANGNGQHGRNVIIDNGVSAITLTCDITSEPNFVASYSKYGAAAVSIVAGTGVFINNPYQTGFNCNGISMSSFTLERIGSTFYVKLKNI